MQHNDALFEKKCKSFYRVCWYCDKRKQPINFDDDYLNKIIKGKDCDINCMNYENDDTINFIEKDNIVKWPTFNPKADFDQVNFEVHMLVSNKEFKEVVQKILIHIG